MKAQLTKMVVGLLIERPAKKRGLEKLIEELAEKANRLNQKFQVAASNEAHLKKLNHIIAMERWGQNRLKVALGQPYQEDENQAYQPDDAATWQELQSMFSETRQETLNIARVIQEKGIDVKMTVPHNQMGELSLLGWLRYLEVHASVEGRSIKVAT